MRTYEEISASTSSEPAFSNGTDSSIWMDRWCDRCVHDVDNQTGRGEGCPIVLVALLGSTPTEWMEQPDGSFDRYHCIDFRDVDDDGPPPEPGPIPDPPGQLTLLPRQPYEGVRMFAGVARQEVPA